MRKLRHIPPGGALVEVTTKTQQGRFLLRPSKEFNQITIGVLARALESAGEVRFHGTVCMSNHYHMLLHVPDAEQLAKFMNFFNGQLARHVASLCSWSDKVWSRRFHAVVISDEEKAQEARLRYLLAHGVKEDLVNAPKDWPGIHLAKNIVESEPLRGYWIHRGKLRAAQEAAKRRGQDPNQVDPINFATFYEIPIEPLPSWSHRSVEEYRAYVTDLVKQIEQTTLERRRRDNPRILGRRKVLRANPQHRPENLKRSPAPPFHAATFKALKALYDAYAWFVEAYRRAAEELKKGNLDAAFPEGCFPPGLPFVPG